MKKNIERINRDKLLLFVIFMFFFILFTKLVLIQIFMHSKINITVKKMINQKNTEIARRGDILDLNGKILASSIREYTIFLDPKIIKDFYKVKNALAKNGIEIKENDLKKYKKTSYIPILSTTDYKLIDKIKNKKIKGIGFNSRYIRYYPNKKLLINVLGTIDSNNYGVSGIEKEYNKILHGNDIVTK
ncbi:MAG: hypothetical protein LBH27_00145, partial [Endomicrobium sp.]|nr:hypothetical protein [Endomicrobium sp.]